MWTEIAVVLGLIVLNAFFAMSELALVSSRPAELKRLASSGRHGARAALDLIADPSRMLSAVQIGITLVGIVAGAYSGATLGARLAGWLATAFPATAPYAEQAAMTVVVAIITYLSLVVGELVPKRLALRHAEAVAVRVAPTMRLVATAGAPLVGLLRASTEAMLGLMGQGGHGAKAVTEEEVRALIAEGALAGVIEPAEKEMLDRVMRLADRPVGSIMTPRPDIVWLDTDTPVETLKRVIAETPHSRFPVAQGGLDELVGVLDTRVLLDRLLSGKRFDILAAVAEAPAVHEETPVPRLLDIFRRSGAAMAVVLDEYGGIEGVVTLTDILEAIAGELPGPGEEEGPAAILRDDGSWLMDAGLAVEEVESHTGLAGMGEVGDFHTLAGFILAGLQHLPSVGEHFSWKGWRFEVVDMDGRRIDKVLLRPPGEEGETADSGV
ncbi:MAG: hemolysin family protein [Magnetospirillum sp.]|nr:hemolysin family protein [Magnetospirillum sp.]